MQSKGDRHESRRDAEEEMHKLEEELRRREEGLTRREAEMCHREDGRLQEEFRKREKEIHRQRAERKKGNMASGDIIIDRCQMPNSLVPWPTGQSCQWLVIGYRVLPRAHRPRVHQSQQDRRRRHPSLLPVALRIHVSRKPSSIGARQSRRTIQTRASATRDAGL